MRSISSNRSRSVSTKRKNSDDGVQLQSTVSYANVAAGAEQHITIDDTEIDNLTEDITKVKSLCDNVTTEVRKASIDPALVPIFTAINEVLSGICENQQKIVSKCRGKSGADTITTYGHDEQVSKRFRTFTNSQRTHTSQDTDSYSMRDRPQGNLVDLASIRPGQYHRQAKPTEAPEVKKFKDTVREAEKSTLVFNLNLGRVPIVNQDTMSTRATIALNEMAATVEKSKSKTPTPDTMAAIDDVLSVVKGMKFYGRATKSFQKRGDPLSGSYCTVPIRYDFSDKDTRAYAGAA
jgi:hypothetical protein